MLYSSRIQHKFTFLTLLGCLLAGSPSTTQAQTAPSPTPQPKPKSIIYNPPPPPSDQGAPVGRRQGGASRGDCQDYEGLTALMPIHSGTVRGLTHSATPTLWFHVPAPLSSDTAVKFVMQDKSDNYAYQTTLALQTETGGLIAIPTQPNPPLTKGNSYSWTLSIYCDPESPSASVHVNGLLEQQGLFEQQTGLVGQEHTKASLKPTAGEARTALFQQAKTYAQSGIWIDSLSQLARLRQAYPNDSEIAAAWAELLQQVDLAELSTAPMLSQPQESFDSIGG